MSQQKNNTILKAGGTRRDRKERSPALSVVFPSEVMERIKELSKEERVTKGEIVRRYVMEGLGCLHSS